MTWSIVCDDDFTNAPPTGSRSGSYPTSTGSGANSTTGVGNGWIDVHGSTWNLPSSGTLQSNPIGGSDVIFTYFLLRPSGENADDSRIVWTKNANIDPPGNIYSWLRLDATGANGYFCYINNGFIFIGKRVSGANTNLFVIGYTEPTGAATTTVDFSITGSTLSATISCTGGSGGNTPKTTGGTDATFSAAGGYAFSNQTSTGYSFNRLTTYNTGGSPATTYTAPASPTTINTGATTTATVTPNGTYTGTITGTPSGTASTGLSAVVLTFSGPATAQTATWTPTVAGTLTITWTNSGSLTNPSNDTITVNAVALSITSFSVTPGRTTNALAMAATGGTTPYTYAYSRALSSAGTFSALGLSGASPTDTGLTYLSRYYYQVTVTDNVSATATSSVVPGYTCPPRKLLVAIAGDSIVAQMGTHGAAATVFEGYLADSLPSLYTLTSVVEGQPGLMAADWSPSSSTLDFYSGGLNALATLKAAITANATGKDLILVPYMIGMNDLNGGSITAAASYLGSVAATVASLLAFDARVRVLLVSPYSPVVGYSTYLARADAAAGFRGALATLADNVRVFLDSGEIGLFFQMNPSYIQGDFLHPTTIGSPSGMAIFAKLLADYVVRVIQIDPIPPLLHKVRNRLGTN